MKFLFSPLGKLDFYIVDEGDGFVLVMMIILDVVQVDQIRFMCSEEMVTRQTIFQFFEDPCQEKLLAMDCEYFCIPPLGVTIKDLFHSEEINTPGCLQCDP